MSLDAAFGDATQARKAPTRRPPVQVHARRLMAATPNPFNQEAEGSLVYPLPGKGVNGESSN